MRHLEPLQLKTDRAKVHRRSTLPWVAAVLALTLGLGWTATQLFAAGPSDVVSETERDQRVAALQNAAPLRLKPVPVERLDRSLQAMQLDAPQQQALRARIAPAPAAAAEPARQPLSLVELTLWDTHAADGDVVVVAAGGYSRQTVLSKEPQTLFVPARDGEPISITGLRDGGGGITLGVRGAQHTLLMPIMSEGQTLVLPFAR